MHRTRSSLFCNVSSKCIVFGVLHLGVWPGFALIAVCSSVIYRKYTNSNDSTTVVLLSHLGCTDMDLQQNMDNNA